MLLLRTCQYAQFSFSTGDDDEPEWMVEFAKKESRRAISEKRREFEARLARIKEEEEQRLKLAQDSSDRPRKRQVRNRAPGLQA